MVTTASTASKLAEACYVVIGGVPTDVHCFRPEFLHGGILQLNPLVSDDLAAALAPFGNVKTVQYLAFKGFSFVEAGNRLVKMEMTKTVLNFLHVRGERVQ